MNHATTRLLAVISTVFLFDFLFWEEKMGLNVLIFTLAWLGVLLWIFPLSRSSRRFQAVAGGTLLAAAMVTGHNSGAAKLAWIISAMCAVGFAQERQLRFVWYSLLQYLHSALYMPGGLMRSLAREGSVEQSRSRQLWRKVSLGGVPFLVALMFYVFYLVANPKFADLSGQFWDQIGQWLSFDISFAHLFFVGFALFVCGGAVLQKMTEWNEPATNFLLRVRRKFDRTYSTVFPLVALRREYQQSIVTLVMLNALLFLVNLTDFRFVWFGFDEEVQQDLKSYVHVGTYALIASILIAMGVLFHIFRNNLNFYPNNQWLKTLSAAWLIQNGVLAFSVAIRNWRYIDFHGLAYKRIGVFLFLLLVFVGLITLWLRIREQRNSFWLWDRNGWALYALLLLNACVSWDVLITRYNLSGRPRSTVDVHHMIYEMSDKNLYVLEGNMEQLERVEAFPPIDVSEIKRGVSQKRGILRSGSAGAELEVVEWGGCAEWALEANARHLKSGNRCPIFGWFATLILLIVFLL